MSGATDDVDIDSFQCDTKNDSLMDEDQEVGLENSRNNFGSIIEQRDLDFALPETVSLIECANGTKVFLIGTAHFSQESNDEVRKIISLTKPDFVVIELCPNRSHVLTMREEQIQEDAKKLNIIDHIRANGLSNGIMQYLMLRLNAYLIDTLGMAPGGEFRAAVQEASKLEHCHIVLGDRPIHITLQRMFNSLGPWTKLRFAYTLLSELEPITKEQIEEMKKGDILERMLLELGGQHPELKSIVLDERDLFLAKNIWKVTGLAHYNPPETTIQPRSSQEEGTPLDDSNQSVTRRVPFGDGVSTDSPSQNKTEYSPLDSTLPPSMHQIPPCCLHGPNPSEIPRVVVAVVGIGHAAGIKRQWDTADSVDQVELMKFIEPPLSWKVFKWGFRSVLACVVIAAGYGVCRGSFKLGCVIWRALH